jgi:hypothetical protein
MLEILIFYTCLCFVPDSTQNCALFGAGGEWPSTLAMPEEQQAAVMCIQRDVELFLLLKELSTGSKKSAHDKKILKAFITMLIFAWQTDNILQILLNMPRQSRIL